jgi:hypothetical protein
MNIGGLVGLNLGPIEQSYATGAVTSLGAFGTYARTYIGGLVGENNQTTSGDSGSVDQSYAIGSVTGSARRLSIGGLIGLNVGASATTSSYWDTESTGLSTSDGGTGLNSDQLQSGLPDGFDPAVWGISSNINNGYPYLLNDASVPESLAIDVGATVEFRASYTGLVTFAADTGTLKLDNSATFAGTVAGMTGHDTIDFADIDPNNVQQPSYSGTPESGTLTVTDGLHSANIALLGNYLASTFATSSDGHDGTNVIQHATTAQTPLLAQPQN